MTQTHVRPATRDGAPRRPTKTSTSIPLAWHQQAEWEAEMNYGQGWRDGVEHARRAMQAGIEEAIAGEMPSAKAVVERLVRTWDQQTLRDAVPDRPDHTGGAVEWDRAEAA